jgi:hypothetical protein
VEHSTNNRALPLRVQMKALLLRTRSRRGPKRRSGTPLPFRMLCSSSSLERARPGTARRLSADARFGRPRARTTAACTINRSEVKRRHGPGREPVWPTAARAGSIQSDARVRVRSFSDVSLAERCLRARSCRCHASSNTITSNQAPKGSPRSRSPLCSLLRPSPIPPAHGVHSLFPPSAHVLASP